MAKEAIRKHLNDEEFAKLIKDLGKNADAITRISKNPELIEAWKMLRDAGRSRLCKDINAIEALTKLRNNKNLSKLNITTNDILEISEDIITDLAKLKGFNGYSYVNILDDIDNFSNIVANSSMNISNFNRVIGDIKKGGNFSDGAIWTMRYISKNADDFKNSTLIFEETLKVGENVRRVDVVCETGNKTRIFYEMKSVEGVVMFQS